MLHYLRIAVTALSLTAGVLLIALWVRSYSRPTFVAGHIGRWDYVTVASLWGGISIALHETDWPPKPWTLETYRIHITGMADDYPAFAFVLESTGLTVRSPHWFFISITAMLGALPWLPGRFSLRTLLIATTLVAVVLGIVVAAQ